MSKSSVYKGGREGLSGGDRNSGTAARGPEARRH